MKASMVVTDTMGTTARQFFSSQTAMWDQGGCLRRMVISTMKKQVCSFIKDIQMVYNSKNSREDHYAF
jgi:hypothetical protein